ncbi:MAG: peptidyl-prolyl cis-trans isomerase [Sedimentisphaerales bacterium]|nr:peptidyl-prolyl cis-trans isomerase [Sedimentisphaerales bacterium]
MNLKGLVFIIVMIVLFQPGFAVSPVQNSLQSVPPATGNSQRTILQTGLVLPVNDDAITSAWIIARLREKLKNAPPEKDLQRFVQKNRPLVSELVTGEVYNILLYQYAQRGLNKMNIPEEAIQKILDDKKKELISKYDGSELRMRDELTEKGTTIEELLAQHKREVVIAGYQEMHFYPTLTITRSQILRYYRTHLQEKFCTKPTIQFQLIDIRKNNKAFSQPQQAQQAARQALRKIREGIDFTKVVGEYSNGFRKSYDGLWRTIDPDSVREQYQPVVEALKKIKPGDATDIIQTDDHFFIAKLIEYKQAAVTPFSAAQTEIRNILRRQRWLKYQQKLGSELLKKSAVGDMEQFIKSTTLAAYECMSV